MTVKYRCNSKKAVILTVNQFCLAMKTIFLLVTLLVLASFTPVDPEGFKLTLPVILAILAGCYEVISRLVPTSKTWSIIGKILEVITWLSNLFDRKRK